jgi:HAD superfamily hydrolase (TIGR01450 family)
MTTDVLRYPDQLYDAYIFDMDGTIYLGDELLPGVTRLFEQLRARNIPVRFLSNNPTKDPQMYVEKLAKLGLPTPLEDIANTIVTTVNWLKRHYPDAVLFPLAEEPLCRALEQAGFVLSDDPSKIDIVIASYDRGFDYRKLQIAFDAMWFYKRAFLIQTNPDHFCPFPGGHGEPDCAAVTAAIEACTQMKCQASMGKPDPIMAETVMETLGVDPSRAVMVGDRLYTDIAMAHPAGMVSCAVLTGETNAEEIAEATGDRKPDLVLDRLDHLLPESIWKELGWK